MWLGVDVGATRARAQLFHRRRPLTSVSRITFPAYDPSKEAEHAEIRIRKVAQLAVQTAGGIHTGLAVCWPGLKDPAGESILVAHNGPRIPDLRRRLEVAFLEAGGLLSCAVPPLMSDGECAAWGHEVAGQFRGVQHAYYVAAGTGLAEAWKRDGRVLNVEEGRRIAPAPYALTPNYEELLAASRWQGQDIQPALQDFLRLRREQARKAGFKLQRIVLGGHFRTLELGNLGNDVVKGRLKEPALYGSVALAEKLKGFARDYKNGGAHGEEEEERG